MTLQGEKQNNSASAQGALRWLFLSCSVCVVLVFAFLAAGARAAYATDLEDCGSNLACRTEGADNSTLVIYVKDSTQPVENNTMYSLNYKQGVVDAFPWAAYRSSIDYIRMSEGVWNVSSDAFRDMVNLETVEIAKSLNTFAVSAFFGCDKLDSVHYNGSEAEWVELCNRSNAGIESNPTVYCLDCGDVTFDIATGEVNLLKDYAPSTLIGIQALVNFIETAINKEDSIAPAGGYGITGQSYDIDKDGTADVGMAYAFEGEELTGFMIGKVNNTNLTGSYTVTLTDESQKYQEKNSMARYSSVTFIFTKSLEDATIGGIKDAIYTGEAIAQQPVVTLDGVTLIEGTDYTVQYVDNVNVGTASIIFTGVGCYDGKVTKTFKIAKPSAAPDKPAPGPAKPVVQVAASLSTGATAQAADKALSGNKTESDPKGSVFNGLQLKASKVTKTSVKIAWKKVKGAKSYVVYAAKCGGAYKKLKVLSSSKKSLTVKKVAGKKVKKGTYYKFIVVALNGKSGTGKLVSASKTVHAATKGGKVGNDKKVTVKKSVLAKAKKLKKGKSLKLKAKAVPQSKKLKVKKHRKLKYESTNPKVAKVSSSGKVTAKKKGTAYVYAYAQNGVAAKVKVVVK